MRHWCVELVTTPTFDTVIMTLIGLSAVLLAMDNPLQEGGTPLARFINTADVVMTLLFLGEMLVKLVASGLIFTPDAYLLVGWNVLDGIIVCISVVNLAFSDLDIAFFKSLRAMRALRPLRMISRNPNMKMVVDALIQALPDVANVTLVVIGCFTIFGITGGTLLRGAFYWCVGTSDVTTTTWGVDANGTAVASASTRTVDDKFKRDAQQCNGTYVNEFGVETERAWANHYPNYDNLAEALITLFEIATLEGWPTIMFQSLDVTGEEGRHPEVNSSKAFALFYILFVTFGSFFAINIFVGVVVHKFQVAKDNADGKSLFLSENQRDYVEYYKTLLGSGRPRQLLPPDGPRGFVVIRTCAFRVVTAPRFELCIMVAILLNVISISLKHYDQSPAWDVADHVTNVLFTGVFAAEMVLKLLGLGFRQYFFDDWNKFDFVIVWISLFDALATANETSFTQGINMSLFRVLRVARIAKLVKSDKGLRALFQTLISSIPALMNVGSLLLLLFFVFAVMGMNLFGEACVQIRGSGDGGRFITNYNNFESFGYSMLTLFRCLTGEDWNAVMQEIYDEGYPQAYPFFVSFVIAGNFMLLNLFIAVILESFAEFMEVDPETDSAKIELYETIDMFKGAWQVHDPYGRMFIQSYRLIALLNSLPPSMQDRMGLNEFVTRHGDVRETGETTAEADAAHAKEIATVERRFIIEYVRDLRIKVDARGQIFYLDVLTAMMHHIKGFNSIDLSAISEHTTHALTATLSNMVHPSFKRKMSRSGVHVSVAELDLTHEMNAAIAMQMLFRTKRQRRQFQEETIAAGKWTPVLDHFFNVTLAQIKPARPRAKVRDERPSRGATC